ncbi:class IV lanthionine synthetase LanL [Yinghuangia seranimata]|uniref:class IV lanthionine synthetase LanL n=1 Tax=Yinghuangia seranimata TaxID=408067 RepID=UPI00248B3C18|nr:class IV lanthionine synthetase LanL [Yinghuangia seranimata]MDI2128585.1 class IV lanthionine synthetase LanL [Yinghuangia seranimata]
MAATRVRGHRAAHGAVHDLPGGTLVERVRAALDRHQAGARESSETPSHDVAETAADSAAVEGGLDWDVRVDDLWCTVTPVGRVLPAQGWKIHVSAASASAMTVLDRVCDVLVPRGVPFKCPADIELLRLLNSREAERSSSGKFITVYPADDVEFVELVDALDLATRGMVGPGVMSDRACRPGSVVHYRYGGFTHRSRLGNDGAYRPTLTAPDGSEVEDSREAWFAPPAWAPDPLAARHVAQGSSGPSGVLVAGRFAVTAAIRHSAKGGVFVGTDRITGADVVVKQARAHVEVDHSGRDARAALRHESALLERLADTGLTPRHIALVEQEGTLFLAQERISGTALRAWVMQHAGTDPRDPGGSPDVPWQLAGGIVAELVRVVAGMHRAGLVIRDLSPTNVMVTPDGSLRLVDLELAAEAGGLAGAAGTPGYRAPEQRAPSGSRGRGHGLHPVSPEADLYSLGGLLFLLATGVDPGLPDDVQQTGHAPRSTVDRLGGWLDLAARHGRTARLLAPAIRGLLRDEPQLRWDLARVRAHLDAVERRGGNPVPAPGRVRDGARPHAWPGAETRPDGERVGAALVDRVLADGLEHLAATATPERRDRLWQATAGGAAMDPCGVQYGAAGVLGVLARAAHTPTLSPALRGTLTGTARIAADWLRKRAAHEPVVLPGLHFGRSGTAWALLEAAELLDDRELAHHAAEMALKVPVRWPNPDVCHGAAGAGFTQLRLWDATGDDRFRQRVVACADGLLSAAREHGDLVLWQVPKDFDSRLAGAAHLGYAHGVAGIGAFLLAAGKATGRGAYLDAALAAGRTLSRTVRADDGAAWWAQGPTDPPGVRLAHWCSGASGAGTFLIRLWHTTGDPHLRDLAEQAATAVRRARWHCGTTACHGLAGNGEFLLDLADLDDPGADATFRGHAEECAELIAARSALVDGRLVPCDETTVGVSASYGTGLAGVLAFLLRLRHGGPRLWIDPDGAAAVSADEPARDEHLASVRAGGSTGTNAQTTESNSGAGAAGVAEPADRAVIADGGVTAGPGSVADDAPSAGCGRDETTATNTGTPIANGSTPASTAAQATSRGSVRTCGSAGAQVQAVESTSGAGAAAAAEPADRAVIADGGVTAGPGSDADGFDAPGAGCGRDETTATNTGTPIADGSAPPSTAVQAASSVDVCASLDTARVAEQAAGGATNTAAGVDGRGHDTCAAGVPSTRGAAPAAERAAGGDEANATPAVEGRADGTRAAGALGGVASARGADHSSSPADALAAPGVVASARDADHSSSTDALAAPGVSAVVSGSAEGGHAA